MSKLSELNMIYIEFNGYCNRLCPWCPNSKHPRNDKNKEMTMGWESYMDLIAEIKQECKPDIVLNFFKYNEPFAFPEILKKYTDYARQELGEQMKMLVHTNGDYLSKINLDDFCLDQIAIMDYNNQGYEYGTKLITEVLKAEPAGFHYDTYRFKSPLLTGIYSNTITKKPVTIIFVPSWLENAETLVDRGGLLTDKKIGKVNNEDVFIQTTERTKPCVSIYRAPAVHYDGNVTACCHIYPHDEKHKPYILGNIYDNSLEEILSNEKSTEFANKTMSMNFPDICRTCADITHTK
jgi:radical SAM protein with 4Fe4S-binding SPASM domain